MDLPIVLSFGDELLKIAEENSQTDAGMRALHAARAGLGAQYLVGGKLESNHPEETNFVPKIASLVTLTPEGKKKYRDAKKKFHKAYRKVREPAGAGASGAFYGLLTANVLRGGVGKGTIGYRIPALVGAGAGLADYLAQGKGAKKKPKKPELTKSAWSIPRVRAPSGTNSVINTGVSHSRQSKKRDSKIKSAGFDSGTFTPGRQLTQARHTASFQPVIHKGETLRAPSIGYKFKLPSEKA